MCSACTCVCMHVHLHVHVPVRVCMCTEEVGHDHMIHVKMQLNARKMVDQLKFTIAVH